MFLNKIEWIVTLIYKITIMTIVIISFDTIMYLIFDINFNTLENGVITDLILIIKLTVLLSLVEIGFKLQNKEFKKLFSYLNIKHKLEILIQEFMIFFIVLCFITIIKKFIYQIG